MDLHLSDARPTPEEREAVASVLGPPESAWEGADRSRIDLEGHVARGGLRRVEERRTLLLPALQAVQDRVGWISEGALNHVCERLGVAPADAYGVASFYALLATEPRPPRVAHVCDDIACRTAGAEALCRDLERRLGPPGAPAAGGGATWFRSPCLGRCDRAPAVFFQQAGVEAHAWSLAPTTAEQVAAVLSGEPWDRLAPPQAPLPQAEAPGGRAAFRLLRRVGVVDPASLDDYRAHGGYEALRVAFEIGPEAVIREVKDAKVLGRGGAAFPMGVKWEAVARQPARPKYVVCNADESEPGTFKDRVLMEEDPFAVVEALTIAGYATGAERGYVYVRGEYPLAFRRLRRAVEEARARGFLGDDVLGRGFAFDIELRRGAGAYICGEETALFNSIEGRRGEPRNKPPFPVTHGLFGRPTAINNVETLVNVLEILRVGAEAYAATGTPDSTGTRLFCLSGCVERPGLYEVEMGITLRELLDLAGGVRGGRPLRAVLLGGAAGTFLTPDELDLRLSFEDARAAGASLGSGVVMAFDDTVDLRDVVLRIAAFFRDESCGQCVPCRVGTVRQEEALARLARGRPLGSRERELALLADVWAVMKDASICGLGQLAPLAVESAIAKLRVFDGEGG
ncbi:MAG TPA: NAD(P)H-dependent oxidoreductase subunit E [Actinomycetota bacterium]|nr:NAD(P)H-dependent oxidoreductase subunit E [Actinomycetota bacterium]